MQPQKRPLERRKIRPPTPAAKSPATSRMDPSVKLGPGGRGLGAYVPTEGSKFCKSVDGTNPSSIRTRCRSITSEWCFFYTTRHKTFPIRPLLHALKGEASAADPLLRSPGEFRRSAGPETHAMVPR